MREDYQVMYSPAAVDDLKSIFSYLAYEFFAGEAARSQVNRILEEIAKLDLFPEKHEAADWEPWADMGMRQMPVENYIVYYTVDKESKTVMIVRIFYAGRDIERIV